VRDIPYLDAAKQLQKGAIFCKLTTKDNVHFEQEDHQIFFAGSVPCTVDGTPIPNFGGGPTQLALSAACKDVVVQRSFSNKPKDTGVFKDLFHKIESYVQQISGPAMHLYDVTPYTFRAVETEELNPIFKVCDTLTSRAEITPWAEGDFEEKMAMLLVWANILNRSVPAFAEAQRLLEPEDSVLGRVIRNAKNRKPSDIVPGTKFGRS